MSRTDRASSTHHCRITFELSPALDLEQRAHSVIRDRTAHDDARFSRVGAGEPVEELPYGPGRGWVQGEGLNNIRRFDELLIHHVEDAADDLLRETVEAVCRYAHRELVLPRTGPPLAHARIHGVLWGRRRF